MIDTPETESQTSNRTKTPPLDWAIAFAFSHKRLLILIAFFPLLIQLATGYYLFHNPIHQKSMFVLAILSSAMLAWLLSACVVSCVTFMRGEELIFKQVAIKALRFLSKVWLSCLVFMFFIGFSVQFFPFLLALFFFLWAPAFCAAEGFSKEAKPLGEIEEPQDRKTYFSIRQNSFFTYKWMFDLGFVRSAKLTVRNAKYISYFLIILIFAKFLPPAAIGFVLGPDFGFLTSAMQITFSGIFTVFALAIWAALFCRLIPDMAKQEIGVLNIAGSAPQLKPSFKLERKPFRILIFMMISFVSMYAVFTQTLKSGLLPDSAAVEILSVKQDRDNLDVKVRLHDKKQYLRWLSPSAFRVVSTEIDMLGPKKETEPQDMLSRITGGSDVGVGPSDFEVVFDVDKNIALSEVIPTNKPVTLSIKFSFTNELAKGGRYVIKYIAASEDRQTLYHGRLDPWQSEMVEKKSDTISKVNE